MSIQDYVVKNDKFEPEDDSFFSFPCFACRHRNTPVDKEPCSKCGHNLTSESDDD